jgi:tetratricopeptide (TPR) repeat protein
LLRAHGYATGAFIGSVFLERQMGLDAGFDVYDSPFRFEAFSSISGEMMFAGLSRGAFSASERRDGALVLRSAEQWLASQRTGRPAFAFLHLYDLHEPYRIAPALYRAKHLSGYDAELEYVDRLLGSFRRTLERNGWWNRSLIIILSDHGEGLDEHGEESHGYFIYQSTLWVPLLIHWPTGYGPFQPQVTDAGGLIDVAPTLLDLLHIQAPPSFSGRSLLGAARSGATQPPRAVYSETLHTHDAFGWAILRSVRFANYKYIDAPTPELYDLAADPGERVNLARKEPERVGALRLRLDKIVARYGAAAHAPGSPGTEALLHSLGYLSSGPEAAIRATGPDPKDRLPEYREYRRAMLFVYDGRYREAVLILERLLMRDRNNLLARRDLGASYLELRQYAKALRNLNLVAMAAPGDYMTQYELGIADEHLGHKADARRHIEAACKIAPEAAQCQAELKKLTGR